jgi:aminopeptidase N
MRRFLQLLGLFLIISACQPAAPPVQGAPGIGDPYYPDLGNGGYDVQQYTIALKVDPDANTVEGSTTIDLQPTETLSTFNLDFAGLVIDSITVNDSPAEYRLSAGELIITPASPLRSGKKSVAVVTYHGSPETFTEVAPFGLQGIGWLHAANGAINVIDEPDGAAGWFPSNNHPRDKAHFRFEITVPKTWSVAANGRLESTSEEGGQTKFTWVMDQPMASYLATINIDHLTSQSLQGPHGIQVQNYFPPDYPPERTANFEKLPEMIAFLEGFYGPYPFEEYGVVVANPENPLCMGGGTAMESQTLSVHCSSSSMASDEVVVHELSHQWFGDSVSLENWKDLWLKEGLATYSQWL